MSRINKLLDNYKYIDEDQYILSKEENTFLQSLLEILDLENYQIDELNLYAEEMWPDRQYLFGTNTPYEDIILGILLVIMDKYNGQNETYDFPEKVYSFAEDMYGCDYKKHITSIYNVSQIFTSLLNKEEDIFLQSLINILGLENHQIEELTSYIEEIWSNKQNLFGTNTSYEDIILGILLVLTKKYHVQSEPHDLPIEILSFV